MTDYSWFRLFFATSILVDFARLKCDFGGGYGGRLAGAAFSLVISDALFVRFRLPICDGQNVVQWVSFERGEYEHVVRVTLAVLRLAEADQLAPKLNALLRVCGGLFQSHTFFRPGKPISYQLRRLAYAPSERTRAVRQNARITITIVAGENQLSKNTTNTTIAPTDQDDVGTYSHAEYVDAFECPSSVHSSQFTPVANTSTFTITLQHS